jgi:hypothetical protein
MYKPSWPKELDDAGWLATYLAAGAGVVLCIVVIAVKREMPSLGDWGDLVGGIFAAIGFIWLIVAHVNSQRRIEEGQKDLENQMAFTQEVVASLARLAMSAQLHDAAKMAEMLPVFVSHGSGGTGISSNTVMAQPVSWHVRLKNEGNGVKLVGAESHTDGVHVTVERLGPCPKDAMFTVNFNSGGPIRMLGRLRCVLRFQDQIKRGGYADMVVTVPDGHGAVECHMDEPPALPAPSAPSPEP